MRTAVIALASVSCLFSSSMPAADPVVGTWTVNVEKSKFSPGPPPRSAAATYEQTSDGIRCTGQIIEADGTVTSIEYVAKYDGKDYAVSGSSAITAISFEPIDDRTVEVTFKTGATVIGTARRTISSDGTLMTVEVTAVNRKGEKIHNTLVYQKKADKPQPARAARAQHTPDGPAD